MDSHHEITAQGNGLEVAANCSDLVNSMPPCMGGGGGGGSGRAGEV